jgi:uncharacterized membrane protein YkvA (DUF1232 family)
MPAPENQHDVDIAKVTQRAQDIENKLPKLKKWMEQGRLILAMVKDYWSGRYREVPYWAISAGALTLLYVLNPLDVIPDVMPGFGYLDDATLVAFCLKLIERELEKYQTWAAKNEPTKANSKAKAPKPKKTGKVIDV